MNKEPTTFIKHILESINNIESFSKKLSKDEFIKDRLKQSATIRELEVIGEAVKNVPLSFRKKYPKIKWSKIAGMRDKLIHHYFGVDLNLTFEIIKSEIPKLKQNIKEIIRDLKNEDTKSSKKTNKIKEK